jgi:hypothetical protein
MGRPTDHEAVETALWNLMAAGAPLASFERMEHGETAAYRGWLQRVAEARSALRKAIDEREEEGG